jgi:enterochelin esterase-like enzyme
MWAPILISLSLSLFSLAANAASGVCKNLFSRYTRQEIQLRSETGGFSRRLSIAIDPRIQANQPVEAVFMTDGQTLDSLLASLAQSPRAKTFRPMAFFALHSGKDRSDEYLGTPGEPAFDQHVKIFTDLMPQIAGKILGRNLASHERTLFGFSNGGGFVYRLGVTRPDLFGKVIAGSIVGPRKKPRFAASGLTDSKFFVFAGTEELEHLAAQSTERKWHELDAKAIPVVYKSYSGKNHEWDLWTEGFQDAQESFWGVTP